MHSKTISKTAAPRRFMCKDNRRMSNMILHHTWASFLITCIFGVCCLAETPATQPAVVQAAGSNTYVEKIPGSLVSFTMVHVPAGKVHLGDKDVEVKSFWIERTET